MQAPDALWRLRWGILSDAHGNPEGIAAMLAALRDAGAEVLFFLGDAVGYLPFAADVLKLLRRHEVICVSGNHEAMLLSRLPLDPAKDVVYRLMETKSQLDAKDLAFLATWPERHVATGPEGRRVLMVHGGIVHPWLDYVYRDTDLTPYASCRFETVFVGQTHRPFIRGASVTTVINVGSCGLPRDIGDSASGVLYEPWSGACTIVRTTFDAEALIERAANTSMVHPTVVACLRQRGKERESDAAGR